MAPKCSTRRIRCEVAVIVSLIDFAREIQQSPYYRRRPMESFRYGYAKWRLASYRTSDPLLMLDYLGIDRAILSGFDRWRSTLASVVSSIKGQTGHHGGISLQDGVVLYGVSRALRPESVVETGVAAGVSTSFIGAALLDNGHGMLHSIELPPRESAGKVHRDGATFDWPEKSVGWAIPEVISDGLAERHHLILEDVRVALPRLLGELGEVDVFFHDDLHTPDHMFWEYRLVWPHISQGGALLSDDSNFGWIKFCKELGLPHTSLTNIQRLTGIRKSRPGALEGAG